MFESTPASTGVQMKSPVRRGSMGAQQQGGGFGDQSFADYYNNPANGGGINPDTSGDILGGEMDLSGIQDDPSAAAKYGPTGPGPLRGMPSPESLLAGGQMGGGAAPSRPQSPTPVSSMAPVPNALPSPSPRAMTRLRGMSGGLEGGGLGLAGKQGLDNAQPSPLIGLLASLLGGQ